MGLYNRSTVSVLVLAAVVAYLLLVFVIDVDVTLTIRGETIKEQIEKIQLDTTYLTHGRQTLIQISRLDLG